MAISRPIQPNKPISILQKEDVITALIFDSGYQGSVELEFSQANGFTFHIVFGADNLTLRSGDCGRYVIRGRVSCNIYPDNPDCYDIANNPYLIHIANLDAKKSLIMTYNDNVTIITYTDSASYPILSADSTDSKKDISDPTAHKSEKGSKKKDKKKVKKMKKMKESL